MGPHKVTHGHRSQKIEGRWHRTETGVILEGVWQLDDKWVVELVQHVLLHRHILGLLLPDNVLLVQHLTDKK